MVASHREVDLASCSSIYSTIHGSYLLVASKFMIDTGAGVIDADYRGTVFVLLFNLSDADFTVEEGDRVAQLIIEKIESPDVLEVDVRLF